MQSCRRTLTSLTIFRRTEKTVLYSSATHLFNGRVSVSPILIRDAASPNANIDIEWDGLEEIGLTATKECANGDAFGLCWVPSSQFPGNETRCDARIGHYERVENRSNYHLLTLHKATKINLNNLTAAGITIQSRSSGVTRNVTATKEVIVAAGAIHTPQLLQLSGIGPESVLSAAGVNTVLELDGVGQNFQDHPFFFMAYNCKQPRGQMLETY